MTSSPGLKITNGLSMEGEEEEEQGEGEGRRVDRSSKSRASVLGYFDRSSVGANWNQLLYLGRGVGLTCIGFTNSVITVRGCFERLVLTCRISMYT